MERENDNRVVMTLDAGGTNFVFGAVSSAGEVTDPVTRPSNASDLELCLKTIVSGFEQIYSNLKVKPVAISFAFPGPADYSRGIIGDLGNLPAFRGGIALGPMLESHFDMPVFINNDGDLFTYGEAISGLLPWVNQKCKESGSSKRYHNLIGVTLGTGFGGGFSRRGELILGDNGAAGEVWVLRSSQNPRCFAEESISIRAVINNYKSLSNNSIIPDDITPAGIYEIAKGQREGDKEAAAGAFRIFGDALGDALAGMITLFDGIVVVGGGLSKAWDLFAPDVLKHLNGTIMSEDGKSVPRTEIKSFNLEDPLELKEFLKGKEREISVPMSDKRVLYDPLKRTGVGLSRLGTSSAVSIGAYAFAIKAIDS